MPLYFAYGSNMDAMAMRERCPKARLIGPARLAKHGFMLMGKSGFASVRSDPSLDVHGVLFDLALSDIPPLDRYEDVAHGLYAKALRPIVSTAGARQALVYIGTDQSDGGQPPPGYMEGIVDAARAVGLPPAYVAFLARFLPRRATGPARRPMVAR